MRSKQKTVTFSKPFMLKDLDAQQPAGDYIVVTDEERITTTLFEAWRRVKTQIRLPSLARDTGLEQYVSVSAADLDAALLADAGLKRAADPSRIHD